MYKCTDYDNPNMKSPLAWNAPDIRVAWFLEKAFAISNRSASNLIKESEGWNVIIIHLGISLSLIGGWE